MAGVVAPEFCTDGVPTPPLWLQLANPDEVESAELIEALASK